MRLPPSLSCSRMGHSFSRAVKVRQKRKKDGFSVKNHPCAITIPYACCNQARSYLLYSIHRGETEHMRMADRDSCRIGGIVRLGDCWQVKPLAHHVAYLLLPRSPISCETERDILRRLSNRYIWHPLSDLLPILLHLRYLILHEA
jgi:hypothetical protein